MSVYCLGLCLQLGFTVKVMDEKNTQTSIWTYRFQEHFLSSDWKKLLSSSPHIVCRETVALQRRENEVGTYVSRFRGLWRMSCARICVATDCSACTCIVSREMLHTVRNEYLIKRNEILVDMLIDLVRYTNKTELQAKQIPSPFSFQRILC